MTNQERKLRKIIFIICYFWLTSLIYLRIQAVPSQKVQRSLDLFDFFQGNIFFDLLVFLFSQITLYSLLSFFIFFNTISIARFFQLKYKESLLFAIYFFSASALWAIYSNALTFDNSVYSYIVEDIVRSQYSFIFYCSLSFCIFSISLFSLFLTVKSILLSRLMQSMIFMLVLCTCLTGYFYTTQNSQQISNQEQPNIIIIGFDSLRPDYVEESRKDLEIVKFLSTAITFENAITPFARTFPAWVSIFSGQYPKNSGARYNLISPEYYQPKQLVGRVLQENGYESIFAMDERRFANIDKSYGFDTVVGPKAGLGDFIFAAINDLPLSNLLLNTRIAKWVFPYSFTNRAVHNTYEPYSFDNSVNSAISQRNSLKPLFLVSHFCLPHWPYVWSKKDYDKPINLSVKQHRKYDYQKSIVRVDMQFKSLMKSLQKNNILDNAIIILLSDHGESHGELITKSRQIRKSENKPLTNLVYRTEWGHGTNILHGEQHKVLLAIKGYGKAAFSSTSAKFSERVSLTDIFPTIVDVLNISKRGMVFDGLSLWPFISKKIKEVLPERMFFLESGFSIPAILSANPKMAEVLKGGAEHYNVNAKTGLLTVTDKSHFIIMEGKQRGVLWKNWLLVSLGSSSELGIVNWETGEWSEKLTSSAIDGVPIPFLRKALFDFYGDEIHE